MLTIDRESRFTEAEMFGMFNVDMVAAGVMSENDVRGNNKFLWKVTADNPSGKTLNDEQPAKIDPKTHEIISGTPERIALLKAQAARVQADPELCPNLKK